MYAAVYPCVECGLLHWIDGAIVFCKRRQAAVFVVNGQLEAKTLRV